MLFNSVTYLFIFLPAAALLNWSLPERFRLWLILLASLLFYGFWRLEFVLLLLFSAALDYSLALWIERTHDQMRRRWIMLISVAINVGILCIFKYLSFFCENLRSIVSFWGYYPSCSDLHVILPLGISFYIFATISYVIDVYRREFKAERNFVVYCCFVVFFPHLVAGPILRAKCLIPQLRQPSDVNWNNIYAGSVRILNGLFLKLVLADTIAEFVDIGFARDVNSLSAIDCWTLAFLFGLQIYFDFAGYSHIAIGSARLFGIVLPENFNFPYFAKSPRDFWHRWHISLSTWVRDYIYLSMLNKESVDNDPLRQERSANSETLKRTVAAFRSRRTISLYVTWALMGLWHGANWTFVLWGTYHAVLVHGHRLADRIGWGRGTAIDWISRALTITLIMAGWIPFRCQSTSAALAMWGKMIDPRAYREFGLAPNSYFYLFAISICMVTYWFCRDIIIHIWGRKTNVPFMELFVLPAQVLVYGIIIMFDFVFLQSKNQFIYFQF